MKTLLSPQTPALRVGEQLYHAYLAFTQRDIFTRRANMRARRVLSSLAFGVGTFFAVGAFATMFLRDALIPLFSFTAWIEGGYPPFALLGMAGMLWCYAWYRKVSSIESPRILQGSSRITTLGDAHALPLLYACTSDAVQALEDAYLLAKRMQHDRVLPIHIFASTLPDAHVQTLFARLGLTFESMKDPLRRKLQTVTTGETYFFIETQELFARAGAYAVAHGHMHITALDLCMVAYESDAFLQDVLLAARVDSNAFQHAALWLFMQDALFVRYRVFRERAALKPTSGMDRAMTAQATPFLDAVCEDLTRKAAFGGCGLTVERDVETDAILRAFASGKCTVLLVGETGVGKMTLVEGLATRMVEERVPDFLQDKRLLRLDLPRILSSEGGGGAQERLLYAFSEVARAGNIVLVLEHVHHLMTLGGTGTDLGAFVASELNKRNFFVIATTTPEEYRTHIERSMLGSLVERVVLEEPSREQAIRMIEANMIFIEREQGTLFFYRTLERAVELSAQFLAQTALPEKALDLLREAGMYAKSRGKIPCWVSEEDVAHVVEEKTHVPVSAIGGEESEKLLHLEERIRERVIGQGDAVTAVASALRRARTSMRSQKRPIANFLFLGPTGVGKTELAKATAHVFFGGVQRMTRFDMSEYQTREASTRLIGNNGEAGLLTEAIRANPFSLLLLDELEKAHPDVLNLFLQIMDDGRITDGLGRTIDCTNIILIATSNAGTQYIQDCVAQGTSLAVIKEALLATELRNVYRPEFLNRFDDVIVFHPLTLDDVVAIAYLTLAEIAKRIEERGMFLRVSDAAVHALARAGFDPAFGARPLRRVIQEKIENALADVLLRSAPTARDTLVIDDDLRIRVEKASQL